MRSMKARLADIERRIERLEVPPAAFILWNYCDGNIPPDTREAHILPGETKDDALARYGVDPKKRPVVILHVNDMSVPRPD